MKNSKKYLISLGFLPFLLLGCAQNKDNKKSGDEPLDEKEE